MEDSYIIHGHDGAADDQMALLLLLTNHNLLATVLTPADSHIEPAKEMCKKILTVTQKTFIPLIVNDAEIPNPFPEEWKDETTEINKMVDIDVDNKLIVHDVNFLVDLIMRSEKPIIYVETGTLTTLAKCLKINPLVESKIKQIIWTGGSFGDIGHYLPENCDGSQTYNSYSDPHSANFVFQTNIEIILFTREATKTALLTREFYDNLPKSIYGDIYTKVYSIYVNMSFYRLWDVLTVSYINIPTAFKTTEYKCKIITDGKSQGKTEVCEDGRSVLAVYEADLNLFYSDVISRLK